MSLSLISFKLKGINAVILDDDTVWRKPFTVTLQRKGKRIDRFYGWREIKPYVIKGRIYYKIDGDYFSDRQLIDRSEPCTETVDIPARNNNRPFMKNRKFS